tara:strand:- start:231 stop:482 length:252 start_codon:yes stop_codon:yes gene_type:complete
MPRFTGQNKKRINPRYFLNEAKGSGFGDGISPMDAEKLAVKVAEKSRRRLLPGQMVALKKWARENVVGMTTRDAEKKIADHLK